ncbi:putative conserved inner-membrane protein [Candidatus Fokinia solitaria]|uniref:Putative conserved inner-membrane protein n=1 Tax=Candidatus Fokinia solitaria TaxID=1802984 RepID=A0A2U8BSC4_9RICK|nr:Bax inhibitor-1/YccA family protein [Candidatus Fokinia solitaria]AWD33254.1 putative conserved inner-membrane protein [Candidatus Fokinia solitaria]
MSRYEKRYYANVENARSSHASSVTYDVGLRAYMIKVYRDMAISLGITAFVAFLIMLLPPLQRLLFGTPLYMVFMFAPLAIGWYSSAKFMTMSHSQVRTMLWLLAASIGVSVSIISIASGVDLAMRAAIITTGMFGGMSIYGYTTKSDLSGIGSFAVMGLIGMVIASVINIFLQSSAMYYVLSAVGVLVFTIMIAYDTQRVRDTYYVLGGEDSAMTEKVAVYGAMTLYMDFINLFINVLQLLRFVSGRRD